MASLFSRGSSRLNQALLILFVLSIISFSLLTLYAVTHHSSNTRDIKELRARAYHHGPSQSQPFSKHDVKNNAKSETSHLKEIIRNTKSEDVKSVVLKNSSQLHSNHHLINANHFKSKISFEEILAKSKLNFNVHIFYYPWYKSLEVDGKYTHWNHEVIPDWHKSKTQKELVRKRQYVPPGDIGANFYPKLGPYSSHEHQVIDTHMQQMKFMGVGVVCVSWYPPKYLKDKETQVDDLMLVLFDTAAKYGVKITFHIEPYENRSGQTLFEVSKFIIDKYGNHSAFYRTDFKGRNLPVYYVYDSYQIPEKSWALALKPGNTYSVRNTKYDAIFLGLLVERNHFKHLALSGFDGFYTYFASNGFSYGSSWKNWNEIDKKAKEYNLIFVPSIGPGYLDTRVRPWNRENARLRVNGKYYRHSFYNALSTKPHMLSITSFNEWHEGTQVEPAIPKVNDGFKYMDYSPNTPEFYLNLTRQFVDEYTKNMSLVLDTHKHGDF